MSVYLWFKIFYYRINKIQKKTFTLKWKKVVFFCLTAVFFYASPLSAKKSVTDLLGRTIMVPESPQRVVALAPSITEIIYALGQQNRLKGVSRFSNYPPEAIKLPRVGSYVCLDLERIVALKPDLCFAIKDGNPKEVIDRLESLGIPVYAVNPKNLETVMQTLLEIGNLLCAKENAQKLVQNMNIRIDRVKSIVKRSSKRPRVFFQIGIYPIVSVGTDTFIHELISLAGGYNVAQGPIPYPRYSKEEILDLLPEVIIITSMARHAVFEQVKAEWGRWPDLPAARKNRIFLMESNLFDRPTPRLVDGLELLVEIIHPELSEELR